MSNKIVRSSELSKSFMLCFPSFICYQITEKRHFCYEFNCRTLKILWCCILNLTGLNMGNKWVAIKLKLFVVKENRYARKELSKFMIQTEKLLQYDLKYNVKNLTSPFGLKKLDWWSITIFKNRKTRFYAEMLHKMRLFIR